MSKNYVWVVEIRHIELGWHPLAYSEFAYLTRAPARARAKRLSVLGGNVRVVKYIKA